MTDARLPAPTWFSGLRRRTGVAGTAAGRDHHGPGAGPPRPSPRPGGAGAAARRRGNDFAETGAWAVAERAAAGDGARGPSPEQRRGGFVDLSGWAGARGGPGAPRPEPSGPPVRDPGRRRGEGGRGARRRSGARDATSGDRTRHGRRDEPPPSRGTPSAHGLPTGSATAVAVAPRPDLREAVRVGVGLLLGLVLGWVVLVVVRSPAPDAGDQLAARIDLVIAETLLAERVLSFSYWISSVTTLLVIGGAIFRFWVVPPHIGVVGEDGVVHARTRRPGGGNVADASLRGAAVVGVVAAAFLVPLRTIALSGGHVAEATDAGALWFVANSRFGDSVVLRIAGLAILLLALSDGPWLWRGGDGAAATGRDPLVGRATRRRVTFGAGLLVVLFGYAMTGHPQATDPWVVHVVAQWVHVTVAAAWFGGVCFLGIELRQQWRRGSARYTGEVIGRFSALAEVTIALAAITGVLLANSQIHEPMAVFESAYGRAFVGKMIALGVVLAVGGYNRQRLVPAIVERDEADAWDHLRRALVVEVTLIALGVLLMTAAMTSGGI